MKTALAFLICVLTVVPIRGQQEHSDNLDNVLEHTPMAAVFALRLCDVQSDSPTWKELIATSVAAYAMSAAPAWVLKHTTHELRPDKSNRHSFPSGHTTMAFSGATVLMHEYGGVSPWITVGGYTLATLVAADRVLGDRHYTHDVLAGAAIGFGATELTYWLKRKLIKNRNIDVGFSGLQFDVAVRW